MDKLMEVLMIAVYYMYFFQYTNFLVKEEMAKSQMVYIKKSLLTMSWDIFVFLNGKGTNEQNNI